MKYPMIRLIYLVCFSLATIGSATNAHAQGPIDDAVDHVGIGVGVARYDPISSDGRTSQGIVVAYRWHSFRSGWGPTFGLDFHSTDFDQTFTGLEAPLGSFRTRAVLAGFGHTRRFERLSASASLNAGYAFNRFTVAGEAFPAFAQSGSPLVGVHVDNSWIVKPDVAVWYDVFSHLGLGVSAAYLVERPKETITTASGTDVHHLKADSVELSAGVTVGLWKKKQ
jgi:hypothetical protein